MNLDGAVRNLQADSFDQVVSGPEPVLVDFWSEFCSPCHAVGQSVTELAHEFAGRLVVAKVDVVDQPELAERHGVATVPTILVFKDGEIVARLHGARPKSHIARTVQPHLSDG